MDWLVLTISLSDYLLQHGWDGCFLTGSFSYARQNKEERQEEGAPVALVCSTSERERESSHFGSSRPAASFGGRSRTAW